MATGTGMVGNAWSEVRSRRLVAVIPAGAAALAAIALLVWYRATMHNFRGTEIPVG